MVGMLFLVLLLSTADALPVLTMWNNTYYTISGNHPSLLQVDLATNATKTVHTQYDPEWSVWEGSAVCDGVYVTTYLTVAEVGMFFVDVQTGETKSFPTAPHYYTYACHPSMKGYVYASTAWMVPGNDVFGLSLVEIRTGHATSVGNFTDNGAKLTWESFPNLLQFDLSTNTLWGSFPTTGKDSGYLMLLDLSTGTQLAQYEYNVAGFQPYEVFPAQGTAHAFTGVMMDPSTMMQHDFYTFKLDNATRKVQPVAGKQSANWMYSWSLPPVVCGDTVYAFKDVEDLEAPTPHNVIVTWDVHTGVRGADINLGDIFSGKKVDGGALACTQ